MTNLLQTNDYYLLDACEGYELLTGEKNPYFIIYRGLFNSNPDKLEIFKGPGLFSVPPLRGISALKHWAPQASHMSAKFFCHKKQENYH